MSKGKSDKVTYKTYEQHQSCLIPPSADALQLYPEYKTQQFSVCRTAPPPAASCDRLIRRYSMFSLIPRSLATWLIFVYHRWGKVQKEKAIRKTIIM